MIIQAVLKMLSEIGNVDNIPEFIEGVKARFILPFTSSGSCVFPIYKECWCADGFLCFVLRFYVVFFNIIVCCFFSRKRKMSGFGHRVYKNYDPRAKVLKKLTEEVFSIVGRDPLIEVLIHFVFNIKTHFWLFSSTCIFL